MRSLNSHPEYEKSGGLSYHWRAFRFQIRWQSFRRHLLSWLQSWQTTSTGLVLVGPSGGYCLSDSWLKNFHEVQALDPDPWAPWLFKRQHPDIQVRWDRRKAFESAGRFNPYAWQDLRLRYPQHSLLFCNVIGQLPLIYPSFESLWPIWRDEMVRQSQTANWASFHDLYSIDGVSLSSEQLDQSFAALDEMMDHVLACAGRSRLEFRDHLTRNLIPTNGNKHYLLWQMTPQRLHLIEAVAHDGPSGRP